MNVHNQICVVVHENRKHLERILKEDLDAFVGLAKESDEAIKVLILKHFERFVDKYLPDIEKIWTQTNACEESWENMNLFFDKPILPEHRQLSKVDRRVKRMFSKLKDKIDNYERLKTKTYQEEKQPGNGDPKRVDKIPGSKRLDR